MIQGHSNTHRVGITLQQLTYFLAAVEHGTFSAACRAVHVSQPSLSEQIRRLEAYLGAPLFVRATRRLVLTDAGRRLVPYAEQSLTSARQGADAVRSVGKMTGGVVNFGTFGSAYNYLLTELIEEFHETYPDVRLRAFGYNSSEIADKVRAGEVESALVMLPIDDSGLSVSEPVWQAEVGYVSAQTTRLTGDKTIEALSRAPLILSEASWPYSDPVRRQLSERAQRAGVPLYPLIEVDQQITAFELVARGHGDLIASRPITNRLGYGKTLGWKPLEPRVWEVFAIITRKDSPLGSATQALIGLARKHLMRISEEYDRSIENR